MTSSIQFLYNFLNAKQKTRLFSLLVIMIIASFLEIVCILSLVEYVAFLSENQIGFLFDFLIQKLKLDNFELNIKNLLSFIFLLSTIKFISSPLSKFQTGGEIERIY